MIRFIRLILIIIGVGLIVVSGISYFKDSPNEIITTSENTQEIKYRFSTDRKKGALIFASAGFLIAFAGSFIFRDKKKTS